MPNAGGLNAGLMDVVGNVRGYLYRRVDSSGRGYVNHWKTTQDSKERMLNAFNDSVSRDLVVLHSAELVEEMRTITRDGGSIVCPTHAHDDRVIAMGLAVVAWTEFMRSHAAEAQQFWHQENARDSGDMEGGGPDNKTGSLVRNYLERYKIAPRAESM